MKDEWFEQFMNPTKSVFQFLSTMVYSPDIPKTVKLKICSCQVQRKQVKGVRYQVRDQCLTGCFRHWKHQSEANGTDRK